MHSGSPSDPYDLLGKAKLSYLHDTIRQGKAKAQLSKLTSVFHYLPSVGPSSCVLAHLGCTSEAGTSYSFLIACSACMSKKHDSY